MNSIIYFLLIISLSMIICDEQKAFNEDDILEIINLGKSNLLDSGKHKLNLDGKDGKLGITKHSIVWKGKYDNTSVAIKFVLDKETFDQEIKIFEILNATKDKKVELFGIPRIYYHGQILGKYNIIAMTLFDGTLGDRDKIQEKHLSNLGILQIFKRTVEVLQYIHNKNVVHNDIKPTNLFLSLNDAEVFVSDFDLATINRTQSKGFTPLFASSNFYANRTRTAIDDLQSLVFTIWYIAGMPIDQSYDPEGLVLLECEKKGEKEARSKMLEKCSYFTNKYVHNAMALICADEMLLKKSVPDHKRIINILDEAIKSIKKESKCESNTKTVSQFKFRRSFRDFKIHSGLNSGSWKSDWLPSPRKLTRQMSKLGSKIQV